MPIAPLSKIDIGVAFATSAGLDSLLYLLSTGPSSKRCVGPDKVFAHDLAKCEVDEPRRATLIGEVLAGREPLPAESEVRRLLAGEPLGVQRDSRVVAGEGQ
jgi:hypothetical protein